MALSALPLGSGVQVIVDWLELKVLSSEFNVASISALQRMWDTRRNTEDSDFEEKDADQDAFLQEIVSEINCRLNFIGNSYPFALSESGESLEFKDDVTSGGWVYIFCLFLSHPKKGEVLDGKYIPRITNRVRDLFQACSTYAAAGVTRGHSYSFGFPRPDKSGFLQKLTEIYSRFGEGEVVKRTPRGAPRYAKDEQVDVISWASRADGAAGKVYMLGQVASGNDWPAKSIKGGPIERFHGTWFSTQNASQAMAALFIPFCVIPEGDDLVSDRLLVLTREFGNLYYRYVLPQLAQIGLDMAAEENDLIIERTVDIQEISQWAAKQISTIKLKAAQI